MQATILRTRADVTQVTPGGVYMTHSADASYFPAMALVEDGKAEVIGEVYDEKGRQVTLKAGSRGQLASAPTPGRITIGQEYLVKALLAYVDWPLKWWREAIQNSVDGGGTVIDCGATANPDGTWTVYCDDNGRGMDEATILDKFLVLGGTTKVGTEGAAGGFGKAKEMLLLPWIAWKVHSRTTLVDGAGIDYTSLTVPARVGTRLEVVMPADKKTDGAIAMAFIQRCNLPDVKFTVDGKRVKADLAGGDLVGSVPGKADLFYVKGKDRQPDLYVRARGLFMFTRYIGDIPGFVIAELTAPSVEILTDNRDGFRDWQVREAIDNYAEKIAKDNLSALKSHAGMIRQKFHGAGKFKARQRAADMLEQIGPTGAGALSDANAKALIDTMTTLSRDVDQGGGSFISSLPTRDTVTAMLDQKFLGPDHLEAAVKQLAWTPDFFLINEIQNFKVPKRFFPETMTPHVLKLAKTWTELCRYVLMQLGSEERFGVGFVFSTSFGAAAVTDADAEGNKESWIVLNPFKDVYDRDTIWRPTQDADLKWLYAAAIHECTHVADRISYHDESFAAALTRNVAKCADGYRKIKAITAGIKMRGGIEVD